MDSHRLARGSSKLPSRSKHVSDGVLSDTGNLPQPIRLRFKNTADRTKPTLFDIRQSQPPFSDVLEACDGNGIELALDLGVLDRRERSPRRLHRPGVITDQRLRILIQARSVHDNAPLATPHASHHFLDQYIFRPVRVQPLQRHDP